MNISLLILFRRRVKHRDHKPEAIFVCRLSYSCNMTSLNWKREVALKIVALKLSKKIGMMLCTYELFWKKGNLCMWNDML